MYIIASGQTILNLLHRTIDIAFKRISAEISWQSYQPETSRVEVVIELKPLQLPRLDVGCSRKVLEHFAFCARLLLFLGEKSKNGILYLNVNFAY